MLCLKHGQVVAAGCKPDHLLPDTERVTTSATCPSCGRPLDAHDRHVRFTLPDMLALPEQERTAGTWMSDDSAGASVMMQVPKVGAFVRVLLPIHLTGGFSLTYGLWLEVSPKDLMRTFKVWWQPTCIDLQLSGRLGNAIHPGDFSALR